MARTKPPSFYKNLARKIAAQEFPHDAHARAVFMEQIRQESHFDPTARSPAGAQGIAQFMPATAAGYHINPMNPVQALHAAARMDKANLRKYGSWQDVLSAYNSGRPWSQGQGIGETNHYVNTILSEANKYAKQGAPEMQNLLNVSHKTGLLDKKTSRQVGAQIISQPNPAYRQQLISNLLAANEEYVKTGQVGGFTMPTVAPTLSTRVPRAAVQNAKARVQGKGPVRAGKQPKFLDVLMSSGADRAGVHTKPKTLHFAQQVAGIFGAPLTVGTGTNHSKMTVDGNVSDHWSGNAVDIPASGAKLTRLGQDALIAAGMDPKKARQQKGGLYNINGHQVIFNTTQGGNHWNHLHISAP